MDPIPLLGRPDDTSRREYVVTLNDMADSDTFYDDMEKPGGNLYIPNRAVDCVNKRPASRNTHYMLTYAEAAQLIDDPRVLTVELNFEDLGLIRGPFNFEQTSVQFDKRVASDGNDVNWGLLRCLRKTDIPNWGAGATLDQTATIRSSTSGKNVDVVIMDDGCPYPTTIEYQQNPDGTGYTRMIEYNWFIHNPAVNGQAVGDYNYSNSALGNRLQQHGSHTTGTVAGNSQGWARDADIYNLTYQDSIDYVREFHKTKPINPLTGVKNPTVMNNSWGYRGSSLTSSYISKLTIRGVEYFPSSGTTPGSYVWDTNVLRNIARLNIGGAFPSRVAGTDADMIDAMREGVIVVASAGNSYFYQDVPGGLDYDNTMIYSGVSYFIHRGSSPGAAWGDNENERVICVGASGSHNEALGIGIYSSTAIEIGDYKSEFSNYGPRVDVFAPGSGIQSIWYSGENLYDNIAAPDPRAAALGVTDLVNNNFKKCPGTSMSGPQVTGVLACLAEKYPRMTVADAREYLKNACPPTLLSTTGGAQDPLDAGLSFNPASCNRMLFLQNTRLPELEVGGFNKKTFPSSNEFYRPVSGAVYPRKKSLTSYRKNSDFTISSESSTVSEDGTVTVNITASDVPDGTKIPYIITGKIITEVPTFRTNAISGVYSSSSLIPGVILNTKPNNSTRVVTSDSPQAGTSTTITNSLLGGTGLTASTTPTTGGTDDGFWPLDLPFNITYLGQTYSTIYVGTNSYITFSAGSAEYSQLSSANPPLPKIMITAADNSCQRLYYGVEGVSPNRTYRVRYEGTNSVGGTIGSPNMVWEAVFYESVPAQIDIHVGINNQWTFGALGAEFTATYLSVPLTGTLTVSNGTAFLPITVRTPNVMLMNVRLGIHPAPNVNIMAN